MSSDLTSRGGKAGYEERLAFRKATLPAEMGKYVGGSIKLHLIFSDEVAVDAANTVVYH
jgi:hypothetical protein